MTESERIDAFNRHLDRLLTAAEPNDRSEHDALFPASLLVAVSFDEELRPRPGLKERWQKQTIHRHLHLASRLAWRWTWAAAAVALIALLVVFHRPVLASLGRLFGFAYLPEAGFVNLNEVRVLQNAVTQRHESRQLTALRGLVTARGTDLWLEFSDEARPIDDAWLETPGGQRFDLLNWAYSPNEPGTRGVVASFPPLPPEVDTVALALPEGWRLPLTWVPGTESSLIPADILTVATAEPVGTPADAPAEIPASAVDPVSEPTPCAKALEIEFCVQAAARADGGLDVLVEAVPGGLYTPGSGFSPSMFDVPGETQDLVLTAPDGSRYPVEADFIQVQGEPAGRISTLRFPGAQALNDRLSLTVPAVLISAPLAAPLAGEIVVDLGDNPRPGQVLSIDQTVDVAGMPVHFSQAVLDGDWTNSVRLTLTSDPLDDSAPLRPYLLEPGRPDGIQDRFGAGSGPDYLSISVDLRQPDGLKTGLLRIPLVSAALKVRGPFTLTFDAPAGQPESTLEPQVIEGGPFEPLPAGDPLPMDAYQYTGRALQPGDLLAAARQGANSVVYAASPASGFAPEPLAVLPGQVLAVYPHPDYQGIDYLTGEVDEESSMALYRQLYTLRFSGRLGGPSPRLLVGQFERSAYNFALSFDSRFLAYLVTDDRPGQTYQRFVRLIDLDCRTTGECRPFTASTGSQDLSWIEWSPGGDNRNDYRLSAGGPADAQETSGQSDIFLLSLDAEGRTTALTNLTRSPAINDMPPAHWVSGGEALYYACETGWADPNEYFLCRNDLNEGVDEVLLPVLPWNMHSLHLAAGRWVVDRTPVLVNGVYSLRTFDLNSGETSTLLEWPADSKVPVETSVSPDGRWAATAIDPLGGLLALDIETRTTSLVLPPRCRPIPVGRLGKVMVSEGSSDLNRFNRLVLRFQDEAYTLAWALFGCEERAVEAVQTAVLRLYRRHPINEGHFRTQLLHLVWQQGKTRRIRVPAEEISGSVSGFPRKAFPS